MAFIGFDVYGTLVDPLGMDAPLREHVGDLAERFAATWRERQIDWTFRRALMGRYVDFDIVTRDAFCRDRSRRSPDKPKQPERHDHVHLQSSVIHDQTGPRTSR